MHDNAARLSGPARAPVILRPPGTAGPSRPRCANGDRDRVIGRDRLIACGIAAIPSGAARLPPCGKIRAAFSSIPTTLPAPCEIDCCARTHAMLCSN